MKRRPLTHIRSAPPSSLQVIWRTPAWNSRASDPPATSSRTGWRQGSPYPAGHHSRGWRSSSSCVTARASPPASANGTENSCSPNRPLSTPSNGCGSWFLTVAPTVTAAREVSGSGRVVATSGSSIVTGPERVRRTSFQMPALRPRMVGIQSQPIEAWQVGLSAPSAPPFLSGSSKVFSLTQPGVALAMMRTASALGRPGRSLSVTSKRARVKAPSMRPSAAPLSHTSAFQLMPSKSSQQRPPGAGSAAVNSVRYQKSAQKNESEIISWLSPKLGSGSAPALR